MNELAILKSHNIAHQIIKSNSRRLVIKYNRQGVLVIRAPRNLSNKEIAEFVTKHLDWIMEHYEKSQPQDRTYQDLEPYLFLGKTYQLKVVVSNHEGVYRNEHELLVYTTNRTRVSKLLNDWRFNEAELVFNEALYQAFTTMQATLTEYPKLGIKKYLSRWGCCYPKKNMIYLNIALIHVPLELINYVIYHELAHLKYADHSPLFHQYLRHYYPNESAARKELKKYQADYH